MEMKCVIISLNMNGSVTDVLKLFADTMPSYLPTSLQLLHSHGRGLL